MGSANDENEIMEMAGMIHLQKELEESEYEVAKVWPDNGLLVNGKSDSCASTHSSWYIVMLG